MKIPKELITVTPLSKAVALLLFFSLPIVAFIFGVNYQKMSDNRKLVITPTPTIVEIPVKESYRCGEVTGYKPCPEGYGCRLESGMNGTCEKCPEVEYINCMPGPDSPDSRCSQEYLSWATSNCPGFKGAAY